MMKQGKFSFQYWLGIFILVFIIALLIFLGKNGWNVQAAVKDMLSIFSK